AFDAVINPPHATILAVGMGEERPIVVGDRIEIATMMSCTLSCDHRVVDGALGAELLAAFKALIEDPVRMLVRFGGNGGMASECPPFRALYACRSVPQVPLAPHSPQPSPDRANDICR